MSTSVPCPQTGHRVDSEPFATRSPLGERVRRSRPVSRILSRPLRAGGGHPSGSRVAASLVQPTREHWAGPPLPAWPCSGWGFPSRPVTRPLVSSYLTVSPLPLPRRRAVIGGWRSALCGTVRGSPRLGVTQHPALWSPDFPRSAGTCGHPVGPRPPGRLLQRSSIGGEVPAPAAGHGKAASDSVEQIASGRRSDVILSRAGQPFV